MVDMPQWKQYIENNPDFYEKVMKAGENFQVQYQFPKPLDRSECEESTIDFACARLSINRDDYLFLNEKMLAHDPVYEIYCKEYPLPIGWWAIGMTYHRKGWFFTDLDQSDIKPLVENKNAFIGLAKRFESEASIGWFLGMVKVYDRYMNTDKELGDLNHEESIYVLFHPPFEFIEGMVLLEGKLDELVIRQLKDYEKYYNKNILGKVITGRPRSDPEYWLEPARAKIKEKPDITQDDLAYEIGCDLKTFKINRKNGGFATYKEFKDSVLKP